MLCYRNNIPIFPELIKKWHVGSNIVTSQKGELALTPKHNIDKYKWISRLGDLYTTSHHLISSCKHSILYFGFNSYRSKHKKPKEWLGKQKTKKKL